MLYFTLGVLRFASVSCNSSWVPRHEGTDVDWGAIAYV